MPIRILDPQVAARIAAGEVIERPASIVKELVENAIDAGATRIGVQIEQGGVKLIRVTDNGCGMSTADLALALERHATSKLISDEDLARIATLGFRGEALPSIASAADVDIVTRPADSDAAALLRVREAVRLPVRMEAGAPGTTVSVRDLFVRQPARRKFLRTAAAEAAQIAQVVSHYAMAYPEIAFSLLVDGRRTLSSPGSAQPREAVAAVYGAATAGQLLTVEADGPVQVHGLISPPELTRSTRGQISLFVNRRWVTHRRLIYAVESGYDTMLMTGRHPLAVIDLAIDPGEVDVNVHPTKAEVRFRAENEVFRAIQHAVRAALVATLTLPSLRNPAGGASPPDEQDRQQGSWWIPSPLELPVPVAPQPAAEPPRLVLPVLRVLGQVGTTYIVAEGPEGMYLIDQHAAHERVLFEQFAAARARGAPDVQPLLDPVSFEPNPIQAAALSGYGDELAALGFVVEPFGEQAHVIRAVPAAVAGHDAGKALAALLDGVATDQTPGVERAERTTMTLACHAAVRAGMTMAMEEMRELVRLLERCDAPRTCPHGRPTMVHVSAAVLEREFGRR